MTKLTGLSYRQLDYYDRTGLLKPTLRQGAGSGSRRLYSADDLARARVVAVLRGLHAPTPAIGRVLDQLEGLQPDEWPDVMFVTAAGELVPDRPTGAACYMLAGNYS